MLHSTILMLSLLAPAADSKEPTYPRSELLVEAEALQKAEVAKEFVIVDVRTKQAYEEGHIPRAVWWDTTEGKLNVISLGLPKGATPSPLRFVVYDDGNGKDAARLWWRLRYSGEQKVAILNGGVTAWQAAGGKLDKETPPVDKVDDQEKLVDNRLATRDDVLGILKDKSAQIVDARSEKEYCGETKQAKRGGAIPGAVNLEWSDLIDPKTKKFKSPEELSKIFKDAGIDLDKPVVTYCQSGGRASVMAFGLELIGAKNVRNYYKSWSEWGNDPDTPVEVPKGKK